MRRFFFVLLSTLTGCSCLVPELLMLFLHPSSPARLSGPEPKQLGMRFRDLAELAGLTTIPHSRSDRRYVLDTMAGGGVALLDCDNDGKPDIAVVNDSTIEQYLAGGDLMLTLYRQDANSTSPH